MPLKATDVIHNVASDLVREYHRAETEAKKQASCELERGAYAAAWTDAVRSCAVRMGVYSSFTELLEVSDE